MSNRPLCIYHGNLTVADAAYLAGLIDGEGCISVTRTRAGASAKACKRGFAYRSSICITMTDYECLAWAHETTGLGSIAPKKVTGANHKQAWAWQVWSREAAILAASIRPYLRLKARQADALIAFQSMMRLPGSKGLTDEEWSARELSYRNFRVLNFRGLGV